MNLNRGDEVIIRREKTLYHNFVMDVQDVTEDGERVLCSWFDNISQRNFIDDFSIEELERWKK